ncbi:MAG TPA: 16S rRNA (adenine(1518)-N(6)/adenine(1519)-N(6))-dimethyltransferase RsmA [Limnochorda sp.]
MGDLAHPSKVRALAAAYNLRPSRHLGQNFLIDENIARKIVAEARLDGTETVVEVGPGFGALTQELLLAAGRVVAVERDPVLVRVLRHELGAAPHLLLLEGDAREVDWSRLVAQAQERPARTGQASSGAPRAKVVANLPYAVTAPVLASLLESGVAWERGVIMVQREVAERLTAPPGSRAYGALTCLVAYHAEARITARVPPTVFWPRPQVDSAVVTLAFRPYPGAEKLPRDLLFQVIRLAFQQRRKTLRQALRAHGSPWPAEAVDGALALAAIDPNRRAEDLALDEYVRLARALFAT